MNEHNYKKRFGQNFLTKAGWATKLVSFAGIKTKDILIEIGPGQGIVTKKLLATGNEVFSCEIDQELFQYLEKRFALDENFHLITEDILWWNFSKVVKNKPYRVIASLPYNIAKKVINLFLMAKNPPKSMALIVQKEVADNYTATAPDSTFLGLAASVYSNIKYCETIPKEDFRPEPKVDGGILLFESIKPITKNPEKFIKFIKAGFSAPRKKLSSNLNNIGYEKSKIEKLLETMTLSQAARPQELTLTQWLEIYIKTTNER